MEKVCKERNTGMRADPSQHLTTTTNQYSGDSRDPISSSVNPVTQKF
jgi:hypothetical protein